MARAVDYVFAFCFFPHLYLRALVWFGLLCVLALLCMGARPSTEN